ncbi:hypothetical protein HZA97_07520 [Candidatus Woesearchaeota archaeon]|nr:hypothetical protein [Candidatus Woesearchaeota archaeon]
MINRGLGAIVLALCLSTPLGGQEVKLGPEVNKEQEVKTEQEVKGKPNKEYHYNGYLIKINKFLFDFDVKYVRFYEEQENKINVLEITYSNGVFEKYWDSNDDLAAPEDVEIIKGKHIKFIDCNINWRYSSLDTEYATNKRRKYYKIVNKLNDKFSKTLTDVLKRKRER